MCNLYYMEKGFDKKKFEEIISGDFLKQDPSVVIPSLLAIIWVLLDENAEIRKLVENQRKLIDGQRMETESLKTQNEILQKRVKELEARLNKDSYNSSKPPSSDGLRKRKKNRSLRKKSGRSPGGQPGHNGKTLEMSENPDVIVVHKIVQCKSCGKSLDEVLAEKVERRQVFDIPVIKMEVAEHQSLVKICPCCGVENRGEFPPEAAASIQYGVRVKSLSSVLMGYQLIPYKRLSEFFGDVFGHSVSPGTLNKIFGELYESLEGYENSVKEKLQKSGVVGFDETGMRSVGNLHWLHSASTDDLTYYHIHGKRGVEGMKSAGILPTFSGRAVHDHWNPYFKFHCLHSLCNAHHLRELNGVIENDGFQWAKDVKDLLLEMKSAVATAVESNFKNLDSDVVRDFIRRYENILNEGFKNYPSVESAGFTESAQSLEFTESFPAEKTGMRGGKKKASSAESPVPKKRRRRGRKKKPPSLNLLERLWYNMDETVAFMRDFRVPFDNNRSERDIRMMKVKQKISGTFRGEDGGPWFCRIRGYISTVRKQGLSVLQAINDAFCGKPSIPAVNYGAE